MGVRYKTTVGVLHPGGMPLKGSSMNKLQERRQVFIGNLAYACTEQELSKALEAITVQVYRVCIVSDKATGASKGFGFVDIDRNDLKSIDEIIKLINDEGIVLHSRRIRAGKVKEKPRTARPQGGRGHARNEFSFGGNEFEDD